MKRILIVESSPRGSESASRKLAGKVRARLEAQYPEARIAERDLVHDKLPHLDEPALQAMTTQDPLEAESLKAALHLSDLLTEELLSSDLLVIASPMWNFGIPSSLKAWIDHVVRVGKTFNYIGAKVEGLAKEKKAILILASGGVFSEGPWKSWDTVEPYLRQILGFIGIEDVQTVRAEGMNIPPLAIHAVPNGEKAVEALVI
ncbi:FMN-dependent NADH-azoreductase [Acidicapsa ligni]|uniref:FMN-dependent NADH-azoreductase n=1 Tax=Acidicapsa ligni TaxID=542300 RepID=UPI0021DFCF6B|nr:FMN-dependent NADH-azoreductase [Acidicapsa ligni]